MPAALVSIHSIRRRSEMRAGAVPVAMSAARVPRMDEQLRRRSVGAPAARSMLLTLLGEYVLSAEGGVWQETLIGALGALDYKPQAARQALARSVAGGWLRTERRGRRARVHL